MSGRCVQGIYSDTMFMACLVRFECLVCFKPRIDEALLLQLLIMYSYRIPGNTDESTPR